MTDEQIIDFLTRNLEYFTTNDLVTSILRQIGWLIVKGFNILIDACRSLYDHTFGLVDITRWSVLEDYIREYEPLVQAILIATLVILGFMFILGKNKKHNLITSALIFAVVFTSSSYLFSTFNSFAVLFKGIVVGSEGETDGYNLVCQNLYDLIYIDEQIGIRNMSGTPPQYPEIKERDMQMIDITETVSNEKEGLTDDAKDILGKRFEYEYAQSGLVDVYNGVAWTDFANTYYYRYHFNYWTYYLTAVAAMIVYLGLSYKNVRIIYELFVSRILVTAFSADLSSSRKAVRILESIRDGYYALCFTAITLRSYFLFIEFLTSRGSIRGLERGIILLLIAFCVVDGANIMEKITGVDAGLSSMAGKLIAGMHMIRGATMTVQQARQFGMMKKQTEAMQKIASGQNQQNQASNNMNQPPGNQNGMMGSQTDPDGSDADTGSSSQSDNSTNNNSVSNSQSKNASENIMDSSSDNFEEQKDSSEYKENNTSEGMESVSGEESSGEAGPGMQKADDDFRRMDDALDGNKDLKDKMDDKTDDVGGAKASKGKNEDSGMFERWQQKSDQTGQKEQDHLNQMKVPEKENSEKRGRYDEAMPEQKADGPGSLSQNDGERRNYSDSGRLAQREGSNSNESKFEHKTNGPESPFQNDGKRKDYSDSGRSRQRDRTNEQESSRSERQRGTAPTAPTGRSNKNRNQEARGNRKRFEPDRKE